MNNPRVIFCLPRRSSHVSVKIGKFLRHPDKFNGLHVFEGRSFSLEEANNVADKILGYAGARMLTPPTIRIIEDVQVTVATQVHAPITIPEIDPQPEVTPSENQGGQEPVAGIDEAGFDEIPGLGEEEIPEPEVEDSQLPEVEEKRKPGRPKRTAELQ